MVALDDARRKLTRVTVEYGGDNGTIRGAQARDFDIPADNDWLADSQFALVENRHERRPEGIIARFVAEITLSRL